MLVGGGDWRRTIFGASGATAKMAALYERRRYQVNHRSHDAARADRSLYVHDRLLIKSFRSANLRALVYLFLAMRGWGATFAIASAFLASADFIVSVALARRAIAAADISFGILGMGAISTLRLEKREYSRARAEAPRTRDKLRLNRGVIATRCSPVEASKPPVPPRHLHFLSRRIISLRVVVLTSRQTKRYR